MALSRGRGSGRVTGRWTRLALASFLILVAVQGWLAMRYITLEPGWARPASTLVRVEGRKSAGNLLYVAVVTRRSNLVDLVRSWFDPLVEVRPARFEHNVGLDWGEYELLMRTMMEESRAVAAAVALRGLEYRIDLDALVAQSLQDLPVDIDFRDTGVLGDSAGLMIALEVYSQLSPGAIAKDRLIAGTGVLHADGTVHPVDGIAQKIHTSSVAGARVFLLPRANFEDTRAVASGLRLIPVDTFEQALTALQRISAEE